MYTQIKVRQEKTDWNTLCRCLGLLLSGLALAACGSGSGSGSQPDTTSHDDNFAVEGQIEGLAGNGFVLQNNGSDDLAVSENGAFSFGPVAADGDEYTVSVLTQPGNPEQVCTVNNGNGTVNGATVSGVSVICNTVPSAGSVTITDANGGNTLVGDSLSGNYTYIDAENDTEGTSTFRWLRDGIAITGATTNSYVAVASDSGTTITFEVTPVATAGAITGTATRSGDLVITASGAPVFTSGIAIDMAENTTVTGYTATATDENGDTVTFSLSGGTDSGAFSINSDSGVLSFNEAPDFEARADSDGNNTYVAEITAMDGTYSVVRSVTVTITDILEVTAASTGNIKTVRFEWSAYAGATNYKLLVNSDGVSGYSLLQDNLPDTSTTITLPVHLTDWINARYILEAHDASGQLTASSPVNITTLMLSSIGYVKASNTGVDDFFGQAVSLSADGSTLAVGAWTEDSAATGVSTDGSGETDNTASNSGAVYVFSRNNDGIWEQQAYVKASNAEEGDWFGLDLSLSGDGNTLAVGAPRESSAVTGVSSDGSGEADNTVNGSGAVYVFGRNDGVWSQQAYVKASNTGEGDLFGFVVSLSGDGNTLAVGTGNEDSAATGISTDGSGENDNAAAAAGAVYVFGYNSGVWNQQAYVKASNTGAGDLFGETVSLSDDGNTLVVGAYQEDSAITGISTNGAGEDDNTAVRSGAVYVFNRSSGVWNQQAYVKANNTEGEDLFGFAVSVSDDGNTLVVGARGEASNATGVSFDGSGEADNTENRAGAVYIFSRSSSIWSQQAYVKASNTVSGDSFGWVVGLSGDGNTLAVGALGEASAATGVSSDGSGEADNAAGVAGAVYVFNRSSGAWSQQAYVKASNTGSGDSFSQAVSLSGDGNTLAVGAWAEDGAATGISTGDNINGADNSTNRAGAVYLY